MTFSKIDIADPRYASVLSLRHTILREPLGLDLYQEDLTQEENDAIFIAENKFQQVIGCLLLSPLEDQSFKLRQMAIAASEQGKGTGAALVKFAEEFVLERREYSIVLHARSVAIGFYEKLGYKTVGSSFEEVGLLHFKMKKVFTSVS